MGSSDDMEQVILAMNNSSIQVLEEESDVKRKADPSTHVVDVESDVKKKTDPSIQVVEEESDVKKKTDPSIQVVEVEEESEVERNVDRHCGFCLTLVKGEEVMLCGGCKRRAYCSKECQTADWKTPKSCPEFNGKIHGYGQGHKNWCGLPYGEEDLDWKVAPISGKGLGIVALRDFAPLSRIIVDGMQAVPDHHYHPGLDDLVPLSSTDLLEKFCMNAQGTPELGRRVGLRIARSNHNCDANASCANDSAFRVLILYCNREIKKGDEICYAYIRFNDIGKAIDKSPGFVRHILFTKWGINCPPDCVCRDEEKIKMVKTCKKLFEDCQQYSTSKNVLPKVEKIIEIAGKIGCGASIMRRLYYLCVEYGVQRRATLERAKQYLEMFVDYNRAIYHPHNVSQIKDWENSLKDLSKIPGYLSREKGVKLGARNGKRVPVQC